MNLKQSVINSIAKFNATTRRNVNSWKVVPEFFYIDANKKTFFEEEMWHWCVANGTKDLTQSPEEQGALGQAYIVNGQELFNKFYEDVDIADIQLNP